MTEPGTGLPEDERLALRAYLAELGADAERIDRADADHALGPLAVELAVLGASGTPFFDALAATGTDAARATRLWRALGFPDPTVAEPLLQPDENASLGLLMSVGSDVLGTDATLTIARLIGAATSPLADALVDAFRMQVEVPTRCVAGPGGRRSGRSGWPSSAVSRRRSRPRPCSRPSGPTARRDGALR